MSVIKIGKILLTLFLFSIFSFFIFKYVLSLPLMGHDEAYNLQIPRSLNENFVYQNRYEPRQIHDVKISVGFPLHYLQLVYFKFFGENLNSVRFLSSTLIIFLLFISFLLSKSLLTPCYIFSFFLIASWFRNDFGRYYGELISSIFLILSFYFLENKFKKVFFKKYFLYFSAFLFSLAISSKFISLLVVFLFFTFSKKLNIKKKITFLILVFIFYFFSNFIIIFYSYFLKHQTLDGFKSFFYNYIFNFKDFVLLNLTKQPINIKIVFERFQTQFINFEGGIFNFLLFFVIPQIFLILLGIKKNRFLFLFLSFYFLYKIFLTMFWRHYLIFLLFLFLISNIFMIRYKIYRVVLLLGILINILNFLFNNKYFFNEIKINEKIKLEQKIFAKKIDDIKGKIITNGWYQSPHTSFYTKKIFYDRMRIEGLNDKDNIFLMVESYQDSAWPITNLQEVCDDVILCEKNVLICKFKKGIPFDIISEKAGNTNKCDKFKFD